MKQNCCGGRVGGEGEFCKAHNSEACFGFWLRRLSPNPSSLTQHDGVKPTRAPSTFPVEEEKTPATVSLE